MSKLFTHIQSKFGFLSKGWLIILVAAQFLVNLLELYFTILSKFYTPLSYQYPNVFKLLRKFLKRLLLLKSPLAAYSEYCLNVTIMTFVWVWKSRRGYPMVYETLKKTRGGKSREVAKGLDNEGNPQLKKVQATYSRWYDTSG